MRIAVMLLLGAIFCLVTEPVRADCDERSGVEAAIRGCTDAIGKDPKDASAYYRRGLAYDRRGDLERAMADLTKAIDVESTRRYPNSSLLSNYYVARGDLFYRKHDYDAAAEDYSKAIGRSPVDAASYKKRALARYQAEKLEAALADAEKARRLKHGDADILTTRGVIYVALGRRDEAIFDFRLALKLDPTNKSAQSSLQKLGAARDAPAQRAAPPNAVSPAAGAKCAPNQTADARPFAGTSVVLANSAARVGDPLVIRWTTSGAPKDARKPAYLIVTMDEAVRVSGRGFFALGAGAPNPTGISFGQKQMRAVVPLNTEFAQDAGQIEILPYRAGTLSLQWSVVGLAACGEWTAGEGVLGPIEVAGGAPQIDVHDDFTAEQPQRVVEALKGSHLLRQFKDRFEVYEKATGALVLRRQGENPTFSPTGRFLIDKPPVTEAFEVIDLTARRIVGRYFAENLIWSHADSFLYVLGAREAWLRVVRTFHGARFDSKLSAIETEGPDGGSNYPSVADAMTEPGLDIDAHPAPVGLFEHAQHHWDLNLSVTKGTLTFELDRDYYEGSNSKLDPNRYVFDLAGDHLPLTGDVIAVKFGSEAAAFGGPASPLHGWNAGDAMWLTSSATQGSGVDANLKQELAELKNIVRIKADSTGKAIPVAARTAPAASQRVASRGHVTARQWSVGNGATPARVIGARLDHLPSLPIPALRAGRDNAELERIGREIAALYPPSIATFTNDPNGGALYATQPFVDPLVARPAQGDDDNQPVVFSFAKAGRDLWRWTIGNGTYWLTQTVESGRNGFRFDFTLLTSRPGERVRFADLIKAANAAMRGGRANSFDQIQLGDIRTGLDGAFERASVVGVSGERYLTLLTLPFPRLIVFDLQSWRIACALPNPIDGANTLSLVMHADGRHVTQVNANGALHVYACENGEEILSGAYVDDELVVMDRNGYFNGSDDAAGYVEVAIPGLSGRHLLSQFAGVLKRDDVATAALAGRTLPPPITTSPPALRLSSDGGAGGISKLDAYSASGLEQIQLYADGRLYRRIDAQGTSATASISAAERAQARTWTAIAIDKNGLASAPVTLPVTAASRSRGRLFILAIGIDRYPRMCRGGGQDSCNLAYAVADAKRVAAAAAASPLYAHASASVLTGEQADSASILSALDRIVDEANSDDTIMVSFAGHGLEGDNGGLRLALASTAVDDLEHTSLSFDAVAERLRRSKARVVVLLDVCHAGAVDRATIATNDAAVSRLVTNSGASIIVLSASKGRQESLEVQDVSGGLFSVAFERIVLRDRKVNDSDGDGFISVGELYGALKASVVNASGGRQTPWLSRNLTVGDFNVF
jgi:Flp pilus assembly protein TadD